MVEKHEFSDLKTHFFRCGSSEVDLGAADQHERTTAEIGGNEEETPKSAPQLKLEEVLKKRQELKKEFPTIADQDLELYFGMNLKCIPQPQREPKAARRQESNGNQTLENMAHGSEDDTNQKERRQQGSSTEKEAEDQPLYQSATEINEFFYNSRGSQTFSLVKKDKCCSTETLAMRNVGDQINAHTMYDELRQREEEERRETALLKHQPSNRSQLGGLNTAGHRYSTEAYVFDFDSVVKEMHQGKNENNAERPEDHVLGGLLKYMEWNVLFNAEREVYEDLKFWEDESDRVKGEKGTLLPLWSFGTDSKSPSEGKPSSALGSMLQEVTCISLNRFIPDLLAVGYGSYHFSKNLIAQSMQSTVQDSSDNRAAIQVFSLKNTCAAEYSLLSSSTGAASGVMCISFNDAEQDKAHLLVAGLFNGNVAVYDLRLKTNRPILESIRMSQPVSPAGITKHVGSVTAVRWLRDEVGFTDEQAFCTIGSDGKLKQWTINESGSKLRQEEVLDIRLRTEFDTFGPNVESSKDIDTKENLSPNTGTRDINLQESLDLFGLVQASCFDFHPTNELILLVGCEEGKIYKCSRSYKDKYLKVYVAGRAAGNTGDDQASFPVYAVKFNPFDPRIFLSCGGDWKVRLFDDKSSLELVSFDFGCQVYDIAFSPVSATTFFAVDHRGTVTGYDLRATKTEPICEQNIIAEGSLTCLCLSTHMPLIAIGDDTGQLHLFKLSPNLRKASEEQLTLSENDKATNNDSSKNLEHSFLREKAHLNQVADELLHIRKYCS